MTSEDRFLEALNALRRETATLRQIWAQMRGEGGRLAASRLLVAIQQMEAYLQEMESAYHFVAGEQSRLCALVDIARAVNSSLDLSVVLNEVMDHIVTLTGAERAMLMLVNPETGDLELQAARNMDRETITDAAFAISRSVVYRVAREGRPILTTDALSDPRFQGQESIISHGLRSILCVPLRIRNRIIGVIYADNRIRTGLFSEKERDLLAAFADQAAIAIENARLFERVAAARNLMSNVFSSITVGVLTTDADGHLTFLNRAAEQILRQDAQEAVGRPWTEVCSALRPVLEPLLAQVRRSHTPVVQEAEVEIPSQGTLSLRMAVSPLREGGEERGGMVIVVEDLTPQRRLEAQERFIRETFQRYVSPAVVQRLLEDSDALRLGGQRQEITVLFADLREFSAFSEQCMPEELVSVLNQYLQLGADAVLAEEGTLDKFIGDALMAIFNAPLPQPDHPLRALRAAVRLQQAVRELHATLGPAHRLQFGIGIALGEAVVGNIGTPQQLNYTAIGTCVNVAKRLEEMASPGQILLTESVYRRAQPWARARPLQTVRLAGFQEPVTIYELLSLDQKA
ncbi:MAG: GAF domain-containing protein [Anaerolineae bacterium]|nr:GAF domain-containing protein [Anaerolineae bacterium]